jgi:tryptophan-rich sensory protein
MKKQDIAGIIVYLIILALAAVFGLVVVRQFSEKSNLETGIFILFIGGAIVAGVLFNAILFELGHMLGAKIGGYNITSVSILGFTFFKDNNKTKFKFSSFDGLTGETKILPKEKRKKPSNPVPYLITGTVLYAIEVIAVVLLYSVFTREGASQAQNHIAYFLIILMAVGGVILFYNIIPLQLDSMTDGYRLRLVSGKKNKDAFNKMLKGETSSDENDGEEENEHLTSFSGDLKLNQVYICLNDENYVEAESLVDSILENAESDKKISHKVVFEARANKIYLTFLNNDLETACKNFETGISLQERKQLSEEGGLPFLRAYILVSSLLDRSHSECTRSLDKVYKAYKKTAPERRELEGKLFNKALEIINEKYPDWKVLEYKINAEQNN